MNTFQARIGYARISTINQNPDAQVKALEAAGCGVVRTERKGGATLEGRPEPETIPDLINPGETLVVTRIDRPARGLGCRVPHISDIWPPYFCCVSFFPTRRTGSLTEFGGFGLRQREAASALRSV